MVFTRSVPLMKFATITRQSRQESKRRGSNQAGKKGTLLNRDATEFEKGILPFTF
jgi:hypothetical protein